MECCTWGIVIDVNVPRANLKHYLTDTQLYVQNYFGRM